MMGKKHKTPEERPGEQPAPDEIEPATADLANERLAEDPGPSTPPIEEGVATVEPAPESEEVARLQGELQDMNDRYLRLAAEFDNFRKRTVRERAGDRERAKAELLRNILEGLDDLGRVAHLDLTAATVEDVATGVLLAERKLLDELASIGLERITGDGEAFDPNLHEAVASIPAPDPGHDGRVAQVLQLGYRFGTTLLRPARVMVFVTHDDGDEEN